VIARADRPKFKSPSEPAVEELAAATEDFFAANAGTWKVSEADKLLIQLFEAALRPNNEGTLSQKRDQPVRRWTTAHQREAAAHRCKNWCRVPESEIALVQQLRFRGLAQYEDYERDEERKARGRDLPVTDMRSPNYDYKVGD
jgi:hypothetical protein